MAEQFKSLVVITVLFIVGFAQVAYAGRSQLEDGRLVVPRVDVDGFGPLELRFSIEFDGEYLFVLESVSEASFTVANSATFDPELFTLDIFQIELPSGELYSVVLGVVSQSPVVVFNLLDAALLNPDSPDPDPGNGSEPGSIERGGSAYETLCATCHGADGSGSVAPALTSDVPLAELIETIEQTMPLDNVAGCVGECAADIASFILATFVDQPDDSPSSNPKILHRLNRSEFNNTIRDLLGTTQQPAENFPADDTVFGFDNIAAVLSLSPLHVELYEQAAWNLAEELVSIESSPGIWFFKARHAECNTGGANGQFWNIWSTGSCSMRISLPVKGTYKISARVAPIQAGPDPVQAALLVDGTSVLTMDLTGASGSYEEIQTTTMINGGEREVGVAFLNDFFEQGMDRNMMADWVQVEGPLEFDPDNRRLMICDPEEQGERACAEMILDSFLLRAWRRPPSPSEIAALYELVELAITEGDDFNTGITLAVAAALQSPNFIFRVELDTDSNSQEVHELSDFELASRLSYFLWSTTPDQELLDLARRGLLQDTVVLQQQVDRMLDDPRSNALIENFAGQWLLTRGLEDLIPDPMSFPDWRESLRASMKMQSDLFFRTFIDEERSMLELLTATDTFVDNNLADHYGITGDFDEEPVRVDLGPDASRRGILGQAGLLSVLSYPTRTSPVLRGKWVLGELLCAEPPPPPPGVEGLAEEAIAGGSTVAEVLAQHREREECAVCHDLMDPIGLGLENFNGIGAWRTVENGTPIDPSGVLFGAGPFTGPAEMADMLSEDPRFPACVTEKLFTYSMGRGTTDYDEPHLEAITQSFVGSNHNLRTLIKLIVSSEPFRTRSSAGDEP